MKTTLHSIHRHIKHHHKKYLFGIFGGFAIVKAILMLFWITIFQQSLISTNAQLESWCVLTGQYYTGEYETWCIDVPEELTGGYLTGCETIPGYFTGWTLNESGDLVDQIRIEEVETGCILTWETIIPAYITGCYLTWGYLTWETLVCEEEQLTGDEEELTGTLLLWNGICESGDIIWSRPVAWSVVRDIFNISWSYSWTDCIVSWLSLQLRDHNSQRISLGAFASWTNSFAFDSKRLYSFQQSGLYHIIGNTGAGDFTLYSGTYTWTYSRFFTWYKLRLLAPDQTIIHETPAFTIDNQAPALSGIALNSSWSVTGYLNISGVVILNFTASEELGSLSATLWSGKIATSSTVSWLTYTYVRNLTSLYPEGALTANIVFADKAGNTGAVTYISALFFDKTKLVITWFVFTEYAEWLHLNFSGSEPIRYTSNYRKTWWGFVSGASADYLTAQQLNFSWLERDQLYSFTLDIFDRADNSRAVTGDFMRTNLWQIISHVYIVPMTTEVALSWSLATLAVILKAEVEKFNACKNAISYTPVELEVRRNSFILQMPRFQKSQVKTLVNAFTLFILDKVKHDYKISKVDIDDITKKFDSFLIILKLIRDDDGICQQHLSNYHISQFKSALQEYKISLE